MWLLIIPILVLLLILFSATALAASVIGALGNNWPWLLIVLGAFLFWKDDGRHRNRRHRRDQHGWTPRTVPPSDARRSERDWGKSGAVASDPAKTAGSKQSKETKEPTPLPRKTELPIDVQVKVEQIRRKVDVLLGFADRFPPFSKDLYLVRQTASEYLPRTINAYLALAPDATERPLSTSGQTPHQELKAQLDLLDAKLDEIALDLERQDVQRLLANRQFLEDRFGAASPPAEDNSGITTPNDRFGPPTSRSA